MRLNIDCIRDILIAVESLDYNSSYSISKLQNILPGYSEDELQYHCLQLLDAELIKATNIATIGYLLPKIGRIFDLTYQGHQFLADIRSDTTWNKTKQIAKSIGSESLHAIKDIATNVIVSAIQNYFYT